MQAPLSWLQLKQTPLLKPVWVITYACLLIPHPWTTLSGSVVPYNNKDGKIKGVWLKSVVYCRYRTVTKLINNHRHHCELFLTELFSPQEDVTEFEVFYIPEGQKGSFSVPESFTHVVPDVQWFPFRCRPTTHVIQVSCSISETNDVNKEK